MSKEIKVGGIYIDAGVRVEKFNKQISEIQKKVRGVSKTFGTLGKGFSVGVTAPLLAIGGAALRMGADFEKANQNIRRGTGATGEALKGLQEDFKAVFKSGDESAEEVSKTIADLNTRLGLSGQPLRDLTDQVLALSGVTGEQLGSLIPSITRTFGDWGVSTDKMNTSLDLMFKASQATGIEVSQLGNLMVQYGAPLRQFGFSFEESAALLGKFQKEGVNTELVMGSLRIAIKKFADEGIPLREGLEQTIETIKSAEDPTKATAIAFELFGARAGADMAAAIREGKFEIDSLVQSLITSDETIKRADDSTKNLTDRFYEMIKPLQASLGEIGVRLREDLAGLFEDLTPLTMKASEAFSSLSVETQNFIIIGAGIAAALGPAMLAISAVAKLLAGPFIKAIALSAAALHKLPSIATVLFGGPWRLAFAVAAMVVATFHKDIDRYLKGVNATIDNFVANATKSLVSGENSFVANLGRGIRVLGLWAKTGSLAAAQTGAAIMEVQEQIQAGNIKIEQQADVTSEAKDEADDFAKSNKILSGELEKVVEGANAAQKEIEGLVNGLASGASSSGGLGQGLSEGLGKGIKDGVTNGLKTAADSISTSGGLEDQLIDSHQTAVDSWQNAFRSAIDGSTLSLRDSFKELAIGFASELAAGIMGGIGNVSASGLGQTLGKLIGGSNGDVSNILGDISKIGGNLLGEPQNIGPIADGAQYAANLNAVDAANQIRGMALQDGINSAVEGLNRLGESSKETATGLGQIGGSVGGFILGGPIGAAIGGRVGKVIGKTIGKAFFGEHPETTERKEIVGKLTELINLQGGLTFFDKNNQIQNIDQIELGSKDRFNVDAVTPLIDRDGLEKTNAFQGIGQALGELLGAQFENTGGQLGVILQDQFAGSLDALKGIVQATGLTYEQFVDVMLEEGKRGEQSWLEIVSRIRDGAEVFKAGIEGTGQVVKAAQQIFSSGGKGQLALTAVKNIFAEAKEAGISTAEELLNFIRTSGEFAEEEVNALGQALAQAGISSLEGFAEATDLQLAYFVAAIDASLQDAGGKWREQSKAAAEYSAVLDELQGKEVDVKFNITSTIDDNTQNAIDNGLLDPEVTTPAARSLSRSSNYEPRSASLNSSNSRSLTPFSAAPSVVINVDAQGAESGVESSIVNALMTMEERILSQAAVMISRYDQRGY